MAGDGDVIREHPKEVERDTNRSREFDFRILNQWRSNFWGITSLVGRYSLSFKKARSLLSQWVHLVGLGNNSCWPGR